MMMSFGLTPLGVFPMAVAADHIGAANAILGACVALVIITVAFVGLSRTLRTIDSTVRVFYGQRAQGTTRWVVMPEIINKKSKSTPESTRRRRFHLPRR